MTDTDLIQLQDSPSADASTAETPATVSVEMNGSVIDSEHTQSLPRTFRDAWVLDGDAVVIDMGSARDIHRAALRQARPALFLPLDDTLRRLARKDLLDGLSEDERAEARAAEAACQVLRDITIDPRIEAAASPDELAALTITALLA
ncbi:hypothetical protein [Insolitispirillum peregrinum]|uniref:Uncharacterized protein n=1 Tax=Insolitispirillum peregrinum TaxID=80876 RepID=A0A1N7JKF8_9PROT|nr:hypothetical protein [Insolitispirillum peregrinum]SIS49734.1 hypothetical protein SAMN05421779_102348 [Insolitispirillum peregrinum]